MPTYLKDWGTLSRKKCCSFKFCPNNLPPLPLPQIWTTCTSFFKAKNVHLSDIQNDLLSEILRKKAFFWRSPLIVRHRKILYSNLSQIYGHSDSRPRSTSRVLYDRWWKWRWWKCAKKIGHIAYFEMNWAVSGRHSSKGPSACSQVTTLLYTHIALIFVSTSCSCRYQRGGLSRASLTVNFPKEK